MSRRFRREVERQMSRVSLNISACRACGHLGVVVGVSDENVPVGFKPAFQLFCQDCDASGERCFSLTDAVASWELVNRPEVLDA